MGCFTAPMVEAIITTAIQAGVSKKEKKNQEMNNELHVSDSVKIPFSRKLGWLNKMLWGGSALLAIEHVWHGEIVAYPPFITAMSNPADAHTLLIEIATVGVSMACIITATWLGMLGVCRVHEKKSEKSQASLPTEA